MLETFREFAAKPLKGFIFFIPMVPTDNFSAALERTTDDTRILEGWDEKQRIGIAFGNMLGLKKTAWDVYLIYQPGLRWDKAAPPRPSFWMHQLSAGAPSDLHLNPASFKQHVRKSLESSLINPISE